MEIHAMDVLNVEILVTKLPITVSLHLVLLALPILINALLMPVMELETVLIT